MKFSFKINNANLKILALTKNNLTKKPEFFAQSATIRLFPDKNEMMVFFSSTNNGLIKLTVPIIEQIYETTPSKDDVIHFSVKADTFFNIIQKLTIVESDEEAKFEVDNEINKVVVKQGKSRMTTTCFEASEIDDDTVKERTDHIQNKLAKDFVDDYKVTITPELIAVYDVMVTSMTKSKRSNAVQISNKKEITYADNFIIDKHTLEKEVTDTDDDIYITLELYYILKPYMSSVASLDVRIEKENEFAYILIPQFGFEALVAIGNIEVRFPTAEELEAITPLKDEKNTLIIAKADIFKTIELISGIINSANWVWRQIRLVVDEEGIKENKIVLQWNDMNTDIQYDTTIKESDIQTSLPIKFVIPSITLQTLLTTSKDEDIKITFNGLSPEEEHGATIIVETSEYITMFAKLMDSI